MRKIGKLAFQRVVIVAFFILLQLVVILSTMVWLSNYRPWINMALNILSIITIVYLLYDRTNSSYKIANPAAAQLEGFMV